MAESKKPASVGCVSAEPVLAMKAHPNDGPGDEAEEDRAPAEKEIQHEDSCLPADGSGAKTKVPAHHPQKTQRFQSAEHQRGHGHLAIRRCAQRNHRRDERRGHAQQNGARTERAERMASAEGLSESNAD